MIGSGQPSGANYGVTTSGLSPKNPISTLLVDYGGVLTEQTVPPSTAESDEARRLGITTSELAALFWSGANDSHGALAEVLRGGPIELIINDRQRHLDQLRISGQQIRLGAEYLTWRILDAQLVPEMLNAVSAVKRTGVLTALTSNTYTAFTPIVRGRLPAGLFDHLVFSVDEDIQMQKPDPRFWELVMERLGIDNPPSVLLLDDNAANIASAQSFGFMTHLVTDPHETPSVLHSYFPDARISFLSKGDSGGALPTGTDYSI